MQYQKIIPFKKILNNTIGKDKTKRYFHEIKDTNYTVRDLNVVYQDALSYLYSGDMDIAINYVIYGLDIERNNKLLFNLCKNMTFLLSKHLSENEIDTFRKKYNASLEKSASIIHKKISEIEKKIEYEHSAQANLEIDLQKSKPNTFFTFTQPYSIYLLKKRNTETSLKIIKTNIDSYTKDHAKFSVDLENIESFVQVEEDVKVLGIIMEACILPSKYEWIANSTEPQTENVI